MKSSAARSKEADAGHCWDGFRPGDWTTSINVRDFIVRNVKPYPGNEDFLAGPSQRTKAVWAKLQPYFADERKKGVLAVDVQTPSTLLAHKPGYIDRENEVIVGLQTDQPFKRAIFPYGGLRMVEAGIKAAGFEPDPLVHEAFTKYRKSHNDGVFDAYTPEIMNCRRSGIITGLPDAYGRGRIIGDYRRVALYGVDRLLEAKREERAQIDDMWPTDEIIRVREELSEQMRALKDLTAMAKLYDLDISKPASNAQEASVDVLRLSGRDQGSQRRGDVDRTHLHLPRHLHRARPQGRRSGRGAGAGALGPAGAEAPYRPVPPYA
jgi:formate C-acetyltransferase